MPSALYNAIYRTAVLVAQADETDALPPVITRRTPDAVHYWGHRAYVASRAPVLKRMNNDEFLAYIAGHPDVVDKMTSTVHEILVDEVKRSATLCMSFFLHVRGRPQPIEQDMIWLIDTDETGERITRTVEYVDAVAAGSLADAFARALAAAPSPPS